MNLFDWLVVAILGLTLLGAELTPDSFQTELQPPTWTQLAGPQGPEAGLMVGGEVIIRFADSGAMGATERAIIARQQLQRAIAHHRLAEHYHGWLLRLSGDDVVTMHYMDMPILTVTQADARLNGAASARALAERWKQALDERLRDLPEPLPAAWLATTGGGGGGTLVGERTLALAVAGAMTAPGVRVATEGGRVILSGVVASEQERARVLALVRGVPGVAAVEDRLRVRE